MRLFEKDQIDRDPYSKYCQSWNKRERKFRWNGGCWWFYFIFFMSIIP